MGDMTGKICLVTGGTGGIGKATAYALAVKGAGVVIVARNAEKARHITETIKTETGNPQVDFIAADLSSMGEVRRAAAEFRQRYDQLHVLVNNVGAIFPDYQETVDGYERTFALNHLSYFLLTNLLLDRLKATGTPQAKARVVNVSSSGHRAATMKWDDLQHERWQSGFRAYAQSKLANVLFTYELARRLQAENADVTANVVHPGGVATNFAGESQGLIHTLMNLLRPFLLTPEGGAATSVYLASSPDVEGVSGQYFVQQKAKKSSRASYDQASWSRLWQISTELTDLEKQ